MPQERAAEVAPRTSEAPPSSSADPERPPSTTPSFSDTASTVKPKPTADPESAARSRSLYLARLNEGRRLAKAGEHAEAIAIYHQALAIDPSDVALLGELGWALFKQGGFVAARHVTMQALRFTRSDNTRGMLTYNLGRIAEAEGDRERAAELYQESLGYRDNAAVEERFAALAIEPPPATATATVAVGLGVTKDGLKSLEMACEVMILSYCEDYKLFDDDECKCDPKLLMADEDWAGLMVLGGGMANEVFVPVMRTDSGYAMLGTIAQSYNPGAFGISEELQFTANEIVPDLFGEGAPGWHIAFRKDRTDRDMGSNEVEWESWVGHVFCARDGDKGHCTNPIMVEHSYNREVDFIDEDEPGADHDGLPIASRYSDVITWSKGSVTIEAGERLDQTEIKNYMDDGGSLSAGAHSLRELAGF